VQDFFNTYYAPNNAALAVVGDFDTAEAKAWIEKYFGSIKPSKQPAPVDLTEPRQKKEKKSSFVDPLAKRPALAFAYHMPDRNTPEYYAMGLLDQIVIEGDDSLLYQELVKKHGYTGGVEGGINMLGNMFNYNGPMLFTVDVYHDNNTKPEEIMSAVDGVVEQLRTKPVDQKTIDRALVKMRSNLYDQIDAFFGFGKADILCSFALFDDNPARINTLEDQFQKVTPALLMKTAQEYLRPTNRTVLTVEVKPDAAPTASGN
jgi:zinc protease